MSGEHGPPRTLADTIGSADNGPTGKCPPNKITLFSVHYLALIITKEPVITGNNH